ncbi:YeaC family protein [Marinobacterium aestuariivivens]|uniref:YeaC family protein n=1 Tax=Marinobacterium aestuariivivens TaxID=1698799 RepID=A0ABW1ZUT8_9GAMM
MTMNYEQLIESMTPEMHRSLKRAVELGKWPNGERLSEEQRSISLRAVIAYDQRLPEDERTGYIDRTRPDGSQHGADPLQPQTLKIINQD